MKNGLLHEIRELKSPITTLYNLRNEYQGYHRPDVDVAAIPIIFKLGLGFIIYNFFYAIIPFASVEKTAFGWLGVLVITFVLYYFTENRINAFQIKKKLRINSSRITQITEEQKTLVSHLNECIIPMKYCLPQTVNTFENYVVNKRADTIKECINLYEQDRFNRHQMNELQSIQDMQDDIYQEARDAKLISLFSLFTRR